MIKILNVRSSKEDELETLTSMAAVCEQGSYLHSLLSEELVTWASKMIGAGVPPDVMTNWSETLKEGQKEASRALDLSVQVVESQNEVTRLGMLLTQQKNDLQLTMDELVQSYDRELADKSDRLVGMTSQWKTTHAELQSLRQTSSGQYTEILLLKAEIYDLTHRRED